MHRADEEEAAINNQTTKGEWVKIGTSATRCVQLSREIEIGRTASDMSSRYHIMTSDRTVEHNTAIRTPSAIILIDTSRLKKALLLPSGSILLFLPCILILFNHIVPEPKLITYSHVTRVLGRLKSRHPCVGCMNAIVWIRRKNR
jgi:hypothetical protein